MNFDSDIINRLTVERIYEFLNDEERDIIKLCMSGSFTLEEIGRIIGQKYYKEDLKPSVVRYYRDKVLKKIRIKMRSGL